jgi:glycosyltransferase involved in cell wall biosynthesis
MVSIIIPAFNEEAYLPRLLASINAQDYGDHEIIVADNGSRDRTRSIARNEGARVVPGGIPAVGRNRGAEAARGEYLLFLDADTVLPDNFLGKIMARFEKEYIDICVPWIRPIDGGELIHRTIYRFSNTYFKLMEAIQPQGLGVCILATKRIHARIGGFNEGIRVSEDFDYINRAALVGRFRVYPHVFVYHSVRRYVADGTGNLVQKQFKNGFIYLFTGKASEMEDYHFGAFSSYVMEERNGTRADPDASGLKKLLHSFDMQSRRLRAQMEKMEAKRAIVSAAPGRPRAGVKQSPPGKRKPRRRKTRRGGAHAGPL